jgi:hypothetical protein
VKKMVAQHTSPEKMLEILRGEVKKNRDLCNEILGRELVEKYKRLQQIELLLGEPAVTQQEVDSLAQEVKRLQRETAQLEDKAKKVKRSTRL